MKLTRLRSSTAFHSRSKLGSEACTEGASADSWAVSGSIPAARSLARALRVESATLACCQTRAATPTTDASSASRSMAGSENSLGRIR